MVSNSNPRAFALISTLLITTLLVIIACALSRLSHKSSRGIEIKSHQEIARANAKLALAQALSKLQRYMGPDQRVCAHAEILEEEGVEIENPFWLGVWKTTILDNGVEWPVIGKRSDESSESVEPYSVAHSYEDLRVSKFDSRTEWREKLRLCWLVSSSTLRGHLGIDENSITLVGENTLGLSVADEKYKRLKVTVPRVNLLEGDEITGGYGFWIGNNNLKANVVASGNSMHLGGFGYSRPDYVNRAQQEGLAHVQVLDSESRKRIHTAEQLELLLGDDYSFYSKHLHDYTTESYGMHVDVQNGGFKYDLTPLVFANPEKKSITFTNNEVEFSSDYPIIPSTRKTVLGPRYGHLRAWGKLRDFVDETGAVRVSYASDNSDVLIRNSSNWTRKLGDGVTCNVQALDKNATQIRPVMTAASWHYACSYSEQAGAAKLRFHISPKVKLWNPYNVTLTLPDMLVLMPNTLTRDDGSLMRFEYIIDDEYVENELKPKYQIFEKWERSFVNGQWVYKFSVGGDNSPQCRFFGFVLQGGELKAGECLVYSSDTPDEGASCPYSIDNIESNRLSTNQVFGTNHFFYDMTNIADVSLGSNSTGVDLTANEVSEFIKHIDFSKVSNYQFNGITRDLMPFVLKAKNEVAHYSADDLVQQERGYFPTVQFVNPGCGGGICDDWYGRYFFAPEYGENNPLFCSDNGQVVPFPRKFQIGVKLISVDESAYEASESDSFRLNYSRGLLPSSYLFNAAPVTSGNVRASMVTRAPHHFTVRWWGVRAMGNWLLSHACPSPSNNEESSHAMSPLHEWGTLQNNEGAVLFDLPDQVVGAVALTELQSASVSPYSWHPSYAIGSSLAPESAPLNRSMHSEFATVYKAATASVSNHFDYYAGGVSSWLNTWDPEINWGPETGSGTRSDDLLFIGEEAITAVVAGEEVSSIDEILVYDQSFELNHNLYDQFFFSGLKMDDGWSKFIHIPSQVSHNDNHHWNPYWNAYSQNWQKKQLFEGTPEEVLMAGFYRNGAFLSCLTQFNVNSTSVPAWEAILSGVRSAEGLHKMSRCRTSEAGVLTAVIDENKGGALLKARQLTDAEITKLAESIVEQVKARGPFLSIADFVNRRLTHSVGLAKMGALEHALEMSDINVKYNEGTSKYTFSTGEKEFGREYNTHPDLRPNYSVILPKSKNAGFPSVIQQGDILKSLDPYISVRGEQFTIRCCGQSISRGEVMAEAYIEAVVIRAPHIKEYKICEDTMDKHFEKSSIISPVFGEIVRANLTNKKLGREFKVIRQKWLLPSEI